MVPLTPLFINGEHHPAGDGAFFEVVNPASGKVVGYSSSATSGDCKAAIDNAAKAFETWEHSPIAERRAIFLKAAELVMTDKYKAKVMDSIYEETAASDAWCTFNWASASNAFRVYAGLTGELSGSIPPSVLPGGKVEVHRRAMGVILSIAPWNAPFTLTMRALAVPIICGNTVVLKSSEYSPRSQAVVVELLHEAGLPKGVLNYISVSRNDAPARTAELIGHPMVRKVTFTGSDRVGRIIAVEAAKHLKPCVLELGGKAPVVVLDDADVPAAARGILHGAFTHSGQVCMSSERIIVQSKVATPLIDAVRKFCSTLKAGANTKSDPAVKLSALFTEQSAKNVVKLVQEAVEGGATLILGDLQTQGAVVQPHLVQNVKKEMSLWQTESFGPVVAFATVNTIDEAVELANASEYSLTSSVWTNNIYSAQNVASRLRAGYVNINGSTIHSESFAGLRGLGGASGYGRFDIDAFTDLRVVITHPLGEIYSL